MKKSTNRNTHKKSPFAQNRSNNTEYKGNKATKKTYGNKANSKDDTDKKQLTFLKELLKLDIVRESKNAGKTPIVEMLAHLDYPKELEYKQKALVNFWKENNMPGDPEQIIGSPKARGYRSISNRKIQHITNKFRLVFQYQKQPLKNTLVQTSRLEPKAHSDIYSMLAEKLNKPAYRVVVEHLNHIMIRGSYEEFSVTFAVDKMDNRIVRKLKMLAEHLEKMDQKVISVFSTVTDAEQGVLMENWRPSNIAGIKKYYGPDKLFYKLGEHKFGYYPGSYVVPNLSILPLFSKTTERMLSPFKEEHLLELYCSYGFFSLPIAKNYTSVLGMDANFMAIKAAEENTRYFPKHSKTGFIAKGIRPSVFEDNMSDSTQGNEVVILDPPKKGTPPGLIKKITTRKPKKIIHIFRGLDEMPARLSEWRTLGYRFEKIVFFDTAPGTPSLDAMVLMQPKRFR